jgi:N utilization substance protein B
VTLTDTGSGSASGESRAGGRHRAREVALQVLYAIDLGSEPSSRPDGSETGDEEASESRAWEEGDPVDSCGRAFDRIVKHFDVPASASDFARELATAVVARREEIDALIGLHARNWRVSRMAAVDRNVLRLAVHELQRTPTPVAVVIDEAVDLARRFGSDSSPSFVNGVLDAVAREVRAA